MCKKKLDDVELISQQEVSRAGLPSAFELFSIVFFLGLLYVVALFRLG